MIGKTKFTNKRPKRLKASDRLIHGPESVDVQRIHMALAPLDGMLRHYDRKYGIDCLPELCRDADICGRYGSALGKLNAAVDANDYETVVKYVGVCMRGLEAMEAKAIEAGAQPAEGRYWTAELDGKVYAVLFDDREWPILKERYPDIEILSQREVAMAIRQFNDTHVGNMMAEIRRCFPEAEVVKTKIVPKPESEMSDDIPF